MTTQQSHKNHALRHWLGTSRSIRTALREFGLLTEENVDYFLEMHHHLVRGIPTLKHREELLRMVNDSTYRPQRQREAVLLRDLLGDIRPAVSDDAQECPIHAHCAHQQDCDRTICRLYFQDGVSFDDLRDAVRGHGKPFVDTDDVGVFLREHRGLVKTTLPYRWLCAHIQWALDEVTQQQ